MLPGICKPAHGLCHTWVTRMAWACGICLCAVALLATCASQARADDASQNDSTRQKVAAPTVVHYVVQETGQTAWLTVADYPQGVDIPFELIGSLPQDLAQRSHLAYWLVVQPAEGMDYVEESAKVTVLHANGAEEDVTSQLVVEATSDEIYAGSEDIRAALPQLASTDRIRLEYGTRFNDAAQTGFAQGNQSYAHVEYAGDHFLPQTGSSVATLRIPLRVDSLACWCAAITQAHVSAERASDLSRSPDIKTTVYSYDLEVHKQDQQTGQPLAGASFALRDDNGMWYVRHNDWTSDASKATTLVTDEQGTLFFPYVDSEAYELVEVAAPTGYEAAEPIDVQITTDVEDGDARVATLRAKSSRAVSIDANANTGLVRLYVADPSSGATDNQGDNSARQSANSANANNASANANESSSGNGSNGVSGLASSFRSWVSTTFGRLFRKTPRTGDATTGLWIGIAAVAILALLCGLALRRGSGGANTYKSFAGSGHADKNERKGNDSD